VRAFLGAFKAESDPAEVVDGHAIPRLLLSSIAWLLH
jgi:hypothetical protein